jgi:type II secretory pathway component PulJ
MSPRNSNSRCGFTFIEVAMGTLLISLLLTMSYKILSSITNQRNRGSVDIQELQGARRVINYLRRDFRCAVPNIPSSLTIEQKKKARRMPIIQEKFFKKGSEAVPILIGDSEIHFFRQLYTTSELTLLPATEEVHYRFDETHKCLVRSTPGSEIRFPHLKGIKFELYAHPLTPSMPMILVTLKIDDDSQNQIGSHTIFEMTTTISSAITNQNLNNPYWHSNSD